MHPKLLNLIFIAVAPVLAQAWTEPTREIILVVDGALVAQNIYWHQDQKVQRYALSHPGTYIAFETGGAVYRSDSPDALRQARELYAPLVPLAAQQEHLAAKQKPLAARQAELAKEMATAVGPENVGRVGRQQGEIGQQQGQLGQQQGRLGKLQGDAWKILQAALDRTADACLADHSCPVVEK